MRLRRIERGALTLASAEVKFQIDTETHDPLDIGKIFFPLLLICFCKVKGAQSLYLYFKIDVCYYFSELSQRPVKHNKCNYVWNGNN